MLQYVFFYDGLFCIGGIFKIVKGSDVVLVELISRKMFVWKVLLTVVIFYLLNDFSNIFSLGASLNICWDNAKIIHFIVDLNILWTWLLYKGTSSNLCLKPYL